MAEFSKRIDTFTALRFLMIMTIVTSHLEFWSGQGGAMTIYDYCFHNAAVGVHFFFLLSGFGLAYSQTLYNRALPVRHSVTWAYRKMSKLYTIYVGTQAVGMSVIILQMYDKGELCIKTLTGLIGKFAFSLSMLQSFTGISKFSHATNGVCWFVSTLFILYITFPLLNRLNMKIQNSLWGIVVMSGVLVIMNTTIHYELRHFSEATMFNDMSYGHPFYRIFQFALGILLCDLFVLLKKKGIAMSTIKEIAAAIFGGIYYLTRNILPIQTEIKITLDLLIASLILFVFAFQSGKISQRLTESTKLQELGRSVMYIFLIHYPIRQATYFLKYLLPSGSWAITNIVSTLFVFAVTGTITWIIMRRNKTH